MSACDRCARIGCLVAAVSRREELAAKRCGIRFVSCKDYIDITRRCDD